MSKAYPDINITKDGNTFTIQTSFDATTGFWETKIMDRSGKTTGMKLRTITIGGPGVRNNTTETTEYTRQNFGTLIRKYKLK